MKTYPLDIESVGEDTYIVMSRGHHDLELFMAEAVKDRPRWKLGGPIHVWCKNHARARRLQQLVSLCPRRHTRRLAGHLLLRIWRRLEALQRSDAMTSRDQFEQAYAEDNNCTVAWCQEQRMISGSYRDRYLSRAWHWWQRGKGAA